MSELTTYRRRDLRYTLRADRAFAEFDDPADSGTRWAGRLVTLSAAGVAIAVDEEFRATEGTILRGVSLRIGECRLEGTVMVKNVRNDGSGSVIGGLYYPGTAAETHILMALIAGMESVDLDPRQW